MPVQVNPILAKFSVVGQNLVQTAHKDLGEAPLFNGLLPPISDPMWKLYYGIWAAGVIVGLGWIIAERLDWTPKRFVQKAKRMIGKITPSVGSGSV